MCPDPVRPGPGETVTLYWSPVFESYSLGHWPAVSTHEEAVEFVPASVADALEVRCAQLQATLDDLLVKGTVSDDGSIWLPSDASVADELRDALVECGRQLVKRDAGLDAVADERDRLRDALERILIAVGTSTDAWHIAQAALSKEEQ